MDKRNIMNFDTYSTNKRYRAYRCANLLIPIKIPGFPGYHECWAKEMTKHRPSRSSARRAAINDFEF